MATTSFTGKSFLWRSLLAFMIVFATYNPSEISYYHWTILKVFDDLSVLIDPVRAVAGITLIIGWVVIIHATIRSLGVIGLILAAAFFAALFWLLVDSGLLPPDNIIVIQYVLLIIISLVLATGVSWSHIRRRLTGQMDVDEVDNE